MAMGSYAEMNSFVGKFESLWKSGRDASLMFETHAGQACVTLRLGLGEHPHKQYQEQKLKKKVSPSQQRRRDRRAAARVEANENDLSVRNEATEKEANKDTEDREEETLSCDFFACTGKAKACLKTDKTTKHNNKFDSYSVQRSFINGKYYLFINIYLKNFP